MSTDYPIQIDVWTVDQGRRDELARVLTDLLKRLVVPRAGFLSAQLYESLNGGNVLLHVRMRTAKDRLELTDSADVRAAYRAARRIARSHSNFYRVVESFGDTCGPEGAR